MTRMRCIANLVCLAFFAKAWFVGHAGIVMSWALHAGAMNVAHDFDMYSAGLSSFQPLVLAYASLKLTQPCQ